MSALIRRAQSFAEIQQYLVQAASDLFGGYGVPVEHTFGGAADVKGPAIMAVIGYAATTARGALLILTSRSIVSDLAPEEMKAANLPQEVALRDVLGEFANMLLGRVKNKLLAHDMVPLLTTPTTVFGDDLQLPAPNSGMSAWHTFTTDKGAVFVRFDATFEADFVLDPPVEDGDAVLAEGEMIAF